MILILLSLIFCSLKFEETPSETIRYAPQIKNELVGTQGGQALENGIKLRKSKDKGGIIYFMKDNEFSEWSFSYTIADFDLHFPEKGGVYLWYTSHDIDMGDYRGGDGQFNGIMAGIEFTGMYPELVFSYNNGTDYSGKEESTLYRDSFDPLRIKNVKELTIKVICTKKNFKVELYDNDKLLYDSFRFADGDTHFALNHDYRFSITSHYYNTSAERSFKLIKAQLFNRIEHKDYDADKVHAENIEKIVQAPDDILHPDKEMRHFIARFQHFENYLKSVLGDTETPVIKTYSNKILETLNMLKDLIKQNNELNNTSIINKKINGVDETVIKIQKDIIEIKHILKELDETKIIDTPYLSYIISFMGCSSLILLLYKEYKLSRHPKKL